MNKIKAKKSSKNSVQKLPILDQINSKEDYDKLSEKELNTFSNQLGKKMTKLINSHLQGEGGGDELMGLVEKVKFIGEDEYKEKKNITYQVNHELILKTINNYVRDYHVLPSASRLSHELDLSRNTITKHLKEYHKEHEEEEFQRLKLLRNHGLLKLYSNGIQTGNTQSLGIFFNTIAKMEKARTESIKIQNNYVQINNTRIDLSRLEELPQEKLDNIVQIIEDKTPTLDFKEMSTEDLKKITEAHKTIQQLRQQYQK